MRWGVPLLAAVFPQDTFFYVTPDALSPLLGGLCFALSLGLAPRPESGTLAYAAAGLALAAALLTKWTNAALWVVAAAASLHAIAHASPRAARVASGGSSRCSGRSPSRRFSGGASGACASTAIPPARRSRWRGSAGAGSRSPTGSTIRSSRRRDSSTSRRGWCPTFWRGELAWHRTDLALPAMDALYTASTLLLLVLALAGLRGREPGRFLAEGLAGRGRGGDRPARACSRSPSCSTRPPIRPRAGRTSSRGA